MSTRFSFRLTLWLLLAIGVARDGIATELAPSRGRAEHIVLVVWDGMRPDFVTEKYAPHLWQLAQCGVTFRNHHSVYPSLTSVNSTTLATGVYPSRSGMIANWAFMPEINGGKLARMDAPETIRRGDELSGGKYLGAPTIAELVQARGGRTAIAGTKTASLLHDRRSQSVAESHPQAITVFAGEAFPSSALGGIVNVLGKFPPIDESSGQAQDSWTTRALTEVLWKEGVPEYSVLWMVDPDRSQHATAPGSEAALAGITSADANLALVLLALERNDVRDKTDILVTSDHGFSTIQRSIDVPGLLRKSGFEVADETITTLACGQIRVAGNGGTNLYYVGEHDPATIARLVERLQQTDFAGVIFAQEELEGTFPLSSIHIDAAAGADVVMSFRWSAERNANGVAGMIASNGSGDPNKGTHGTLSPFDLHNTFIAAGPDFRPDFSSETPTSNLDVAATIAHLLGIAPPQPLDGRVVSEALLPSEHSSPPAKTETRAAARNFSGGSWRQYLRTSTVGETVYFDEGNGEYRAK